MPTLRVSLQEVVQDCLQKRGVHPQDIQRVSIVCAPLGIDVEVGDGDSIWGILEAKWESTYPVMCMDCPLTTGQRSTCEGSTGLCETCLKVRDQKAKEKALLTELRTPTGLL